ncbi:hypothetical protein ACG33_10610 [Steroidobacter denitrificans]|uniref:HTH lysR-type domain-containing protein n=1 Tax=Steroidobacter denitrificans TaxID=465721 RepID=A0A127FD57_STEDE|nr:LysR substrate-binding domain-containing protein [Steroidobacter denitrificans]AMN47541.1 hypothetical protein ACG33_10610 [Steroidobacter denitrificans]
MNLRQLRYFVAIAEIRSFRKAAERLHIAQPALTRHMHDLEREIGAPLFTRFSRGVVLTNLGTQVFIDVARLLGEFDQFEEKFIREKSYRHQQIYVAFHDAVAQNPALLESIAIFKTSFPNARLDLLELGEQDQLDALLEGRIDICWAYDICGEFRQLSSLDSIVIQRDDLVMITSLNHPLARASVVTAAQLADEPFIVHTSKRAPRVGFNFYVERCREVGIRLDKAQEADSIDMLISLVANGVGVSLVAENIRNDLRSRVAIVKIPELELSFDLTILWSKDNASDLLCRFLDIIRSTTS